MLQLNSLSTIQKQQIRNAFTLIDGESRDSLITKDDLKNIYQTIGLQQPSDSQLDTMLTIEGDKGKGLTFNQFSNIMANHFNSISHKTIIYDALKIYLDKLNLNVFKDELQIDYQNFKDVCCSIPLEENSSASRLQRSTFDKLTKGFVQTQMDSKQIFLASKWIDSYLE